MAKLKFQIDKLDDVAEELRGHYVAKSGKFQLDVDADPTGGLKNALERERTRANTSEERVNAIVGDRTDDEVLRLIEAGAAGGGKNALPEEERERIKTIAEKKYEKQLQTTQSEVSSLTKSLDKSLREDAAKTAIIDAGGDVDLLLPHVLAKTVMIKEGEEYVARVKGSKDGVFDLNDDGDPLTVSEFVGKMREDPKFERVFESKAVPGTGAEGTIDTDDEGEAVPPRRRREQGRDDRGGINPTLLERKRAEGGLSL